MLQRQQSDAMPKLGTSFLTCSIGDNVEETLLGEVVEEKE